MHDVCELRDIRLMERRVHAEKLAYGNGAMDMGKRISGNPLIVAQRPTRPVFRGFVQIHFVLDVIGQRNAALLHDRAHHLTACHADYIFGVPVPELRRDTGFIKYPTVKDLVSLKIDFTAIYETYQVLWNNNKNC